MMTPFEHSKIRTRVNLNWNSSPTRLTQYLPLWILKILYCGIFSNFFSMLLCVSNFKSFLSANYKLWPFKILVCNIWFFTLSTLKLLYLDNHKGPESKILATSSTYGSLKHITKWVKHKTLMVFHATTQVFSWVQLALTFNLFFSFRFFVWW